jgi:hypothetical protein
MPQWHGPFDFMPQVRSVILFGMKDFYSIVEESMTGSNQKISRGRRRLTGK